MGDEKADKQKDGITLCLVIKRFSKYKFNNLKINIKINLKQNKLT